MKKLISVLLAALMCFGVFSGALAEGVTGDRAVDAANDVDTSMIETDLPSGIYDDGRTLIVHPEDGDMVFDYDLDAVYTSSMGTRGAASADDLDAALNVYGDDFVFDNTVSSYPWEVAYENGRSVARSILNNSLNNYNSEFVLTVDCRAGETLSFDYCIITNQSYDYLYVYDNDTKILSGSTGNSAWKTLSYQVQTSGTHIFKFQFHRQYSGSDYYACIDNVKLTSNTISSPMVLPSDFDNLLIPKGTGFLADIEPPIDGAIPVSDAKQLYDIRNNSQGNYYLTCDIDIADLEVWGLTWTAIPSYNGVFDGQGHSIRTLPDSLFTHASGSVKNLSITVEIDSAAEYVGGIVCRTSSRYDSTDISMYNCIINGSIVAHRGYYGTFVGGAVGWYDLSYRYDSSFRYIVNNATVRLEETGYIYSNNYGGAYCYAGGIVGFAGTFSSGQTLLFEGCVNNGDVYAAGVDNVASGGIVGSSRYYYNYNEANGASNTQFVDCINRGTVYANDNNTSTTTHAGGIVAQYSYATVSHCINWGNIIADGNIIEAGGLVGGADRSGNKIIFNRCCNKGDVLANGEKESYSAGLLGYTAYIDANGCYVSGSIVSQSELSNAYAGGVLGFSTHNSITGVQIKNIRVMTAQPISSKTNAENCYAYSGGIIGYVDYSAKIGYVITNLADGSAYDSWHVMKGSIAGYVVDTLTLTDTCAFNNLNSFAGYYGSIEGRDNAVPYSGDLIVKNANYTIKVVDAQTGGPIPNALVNCDGYKMATDAFGMVKMTLPVNVMIQITASKSLYAPTTAFATRLSSNGINTISLKYVGDGSSGGSGSGSGSGGGFSGSVNAAGYSFSAPSISGPTSTATGPNISLLGKTSPAFKIDLGVDLPYSKLSVSVDYEKQTIRLLLNADIKAAYHEDGQGNETYKAEFENKWKKISDSLQKMNRGEDAGNWQNDLISSSGKIGLQGDVTFGGAITLSYANGDLRIISGSGVLGLKASVKCPKHPFLVVCYFQIKLSGKLEYCPTFEIDENSVIVYKGTAKVSAKLTGALGVRDLVGLAHAEGGVECTASVDVTFPWKSAAESLKAKGKVEVYVELQAIYREIKKSWTWAEFQIWPKSKDAVDIDMTPFLKNDATVPMPRDYLKGTSMMRAVGDETLVMNSVFPYGEPQIVQLDDGRLVLVWIHDDGTRTDDNRTALYYSIYDNGVWSDPAMVWDDGTGDFYPVIAADGNNVHIVWQNLSEVLADGTELDASLTKTQICYTKLKWDGTVETPYVVDAAGYYQSGICMSAENGNVVVAWKENSSNNIWNETGTYNIYRRYMTNGSWYSTSTVKSGATLITEIACGYIDGTPNVAYIMDVDGNAATVTDLEVYKYVGSSTTRVTNNSVDDCNIQYVAGDLYWRQDGELRNAGGTLGLSSEDDLTIAVAPDGSLVAVIKTVVDGFNTELYGSFRNASGEWSVPAPITNYYGAIRSFSPIVCEDGSIAIALDNAELQAIEQNDDEAYGTTSMHVIVGSSLTDLIVTSGMTYDVDAVAPGETLPMSVTVYNNSINAVSGVKAEFYDANNELVCTLNSDDVIECGEEKEITFSYPAPAELALTEYTVKVLPASVDDDIPDNNETSVTIGYADVAIENGRFNRTDTGATVEADITNSGFTAAENVVVSLRYQGIDGDFLGSIELGTLAAGTSEHTSFIIPSTYLENSDELDLNTFYLYIETDTEEAHAYNNSETIVDEPIRVTDILLNIHEKDMLVHETLQLTATIMPLDAANQLVRWASTNVDVATVDENGLVSCVGEGTATIYAISADGIFSEGCVINAEYPYYTVTFLDDDGTVLKTEQVKETDDATPPEVADRVGWSFVGWDGDYTNISGDVTLTAQYQINTYHVIYYINGEVYHTDEFEYGAEITPLDEPEIEGYTFMGWDYIPEVMPAEDVIVTGEVEINSYRLNYYVDGKFYQRVTYEYGAAITPLDEPTKEDYVFSGWSEMPETMPAHNVSVYGTFSIMTFTVTFLDWDDSIIEEQQVEIHADAVAPTDPTRTGYTFAGWDGDFTAVTEDVTIKATYTINEYTVTFMDWDGTVLSEQTVEYGASAIAPEIPERPGYTFTGWDVDFSCIEDDTVVTAQYINNAEIKYYEKTEAAELTSGYYVVYGVNGDYCGAMNNTLSSNRMGLTDVEIVDDRIQNPDETIVWYIEVGEDGVITLYNEASEKYVEITINNASGFSLATEPTCGYTYEFDEVTGTYLLQSTSETGGDRCISIYQTDFRCLTSGGAKELYLYKMANNHTVTFVDWNGTVLAVQQVEDGAAATPPEEPEREGYTFTSWDTEFENVTEDIVVTAQYSINSYTLTINYLYEDGTVASETYSAEFEYGASYSIASPEIEGFTADTPVVEGNMGAEDTVVNVTYISNTPAFIPGDVNGDGEVNASDAILIMRYALGIIELTDQQLLAADVNDDGEVNASDAIIIMRKALGIIA